MQPTEKYPTLIPKTKKELAVEYELSRDTIRVMCHRIEITTRGKLNVHELRRFYRHYGVPVQEFAG